MKNSFFIFLFLSLNAFSQSVYKPVSTINIKSDFFTCDNQNNIYVVKGNELSKYNSTGKLLYKYSNKTLGNIDFVDVSNLLKILVFYKNYLQVVYLDNTLSNNGEPVVLDKIGYQQAQLACTSYNNGIWLYDQQNLELVRLNQNLEKSVGTGNLSILLNITMQPTYLLEHDNKVYLNNPSTGILIFDIYGTYFKTIPIKNVLSFSPIGDNVYVMTTSDKIQVYNLKTTDIEEIITPEKDFLNFKLKNNFIFFQNKENITIYSAE